MQKIFLCFVLVSLLFLHIPKQTVAFDFKGEYTFYAYTQIVDKRCTVSKNGKLFFVSCKSDVAKEVKQKLDDVIGESVSFFGDKNLFDKVCMQLGKTKTYFVDDLCVAEGFCQQIEGYVQSNSDKINFQVAFDGDKIVVGTPVIFGGF